MPVFRPLPLMTLATLVALAILISLGNWQMDRLGWKEALIARVDARVELAPVPLEQALVRATPEEIVYVPVTVTGTFDHAREIHLFGQNLDGHVGYFIFTPLIRETLPTVLVNRGFVPQAQKNPATRVEGQVEGQVTVTGLARASTTRTRFQPHNSPATNEWYSRDLDAMATHLGEARLVPVYVEAGPAPESGLGRLPQRGQTRITFRNSHLGYALTWYGLAVTLLGVYIAVHISAGRIGLRRSKE